MYDLRLAIIKLKVPLGMHIMTIWRYAICYLVETFKPKKGHFTGNKVLTLSCS